MKTKGKPNEIDVVIGQNLREIRKIRGISQSYLASKIGVTYQQIQKYECAKDRISASKLIIIAVELCVSLECFYPKEYQSVVNHNLQYNLEKMEKSEIKLALLARYIKDNKNHPL